MAKEIAIKVKMLIDGKQHLVEASASAKDLSRAFAETSRTISRVRSGLFSLSQATQAFSNTLCGVQQIQQAMQRFTEEYSVQAQNEKRLAEVMRERIGDSDGREVLCGMLVAGMRARRKYVKSEM